MNVKKDPNEEDRIVMYTDQAIGIFEPCREISSQKVKEYETRMRIIEYQSKGACLTAEIAMWERVANLATLIDKNDQQLWEFESLIKRLYSNKSLQGLGFSQNTKKYLEKKSQDIEYEDTENPD